MIAALLGRLDVPGPSVVQKYESIPQNYSDVVAVAEEETIESPERVKDKEVAVVPHFLRAYDVSNIGILLSYFAVGLVSRLTQTPIQYYLIHYLNASATVFSANNAFHRVPGTLKIVFGMLSDGISILGYRRKPWLTIGWSGFVLVSLWFAYLGTPGVYMTVFLVFFSTCFETLADVCTDTLCVERANFETNQMKGSLQATGYIFKASGKILGSVAGTYLYDNDTKYSLDIAQMFLLQGAVPIICMGGVLWSLLEIASTRSLLSFREQMIELWNMLQLRAVWRPMIFLYTYFIMQVPNSAWSNFLVVGLGFEDRQLGYLTIASAIVGWVGYVLYRTFLFTMSWRLLYVGTSLVSFLFSLMQVLLVLRVNNRLGIPDTVFAVGDDLVVNLMESIHVMPYIIMFVMLCPEGAEGTTFALLTTISSLAGTVGGTIGTYLTRIWDVSNPTLAAGDFSGILRLTLLTSLIQLAPISLVWILPDNREDHQAEINKRRSSFWGGLVLAIVTVVSLMFTLFVNFSLLLK